MVVMCRIVLNTASSFDFSIPLETIVAPLWNEKWQGLSMLSMVSHMWLYCTVCTCTAQLYILFVLWENWVSRACQWLSNFGNWMRLIRRCKQVLLVWWWHLELISFGIFVNCASDVNLGQYVHFRCHACTAWIGFAFVHVQYVGLYLFFFNFLCLSPTCYSLLPSPPTSFPFHTLFVYSFLSFFNFFYRCSCFSWSISSCTCVLPTTTCTRNTLSDVQNVTAYTHVHVYTR